MSANYKYLFGPVPSRRLGRSLGIDLTPDKTCSFDCIFCQCGSTEQLEIERGEFVPLDAVCAELELWLSDDGMADVITFAGSGEPTLYNRLGELIDFIQARTKIPVMVLTNGTLLDRPDVRNETAQADIVKVSLSAWDDASYEAVNRPAAGLSFDQLVAGERAFRAKFTGQLWMEVFLMEGINAERSAVEKIARIAKEIGPDKIHLNTSIRPPADAKAQAVEKEKMESFCDLFTPRAEVIASFKAASVSKEKKWSPQELVGLIRRHPATAAQLSEANGISMEVLRPMLASLFAEGLLKKEMRDGEAYYR